MKLYPTNEFRATEQWPHSICAGCVVFRFVHEKVEVLLLVRKAGEFPEFIDGDIDSYHLPKGHLNMGESLEDAALRETAEEAGCETEIQTYLGARLNQYIDVGIERDKTIHYFAAQWVKDLDGIDNEHSAKLWTSVDTAIKKVGGTNPKREDEVLRSFKKYLEILNAA